MIFAFHRGLCSIVSQQAVLAAFCRAERVEEIVAS